MDISYHQATLLIGTVDSLSSSATIIRPTDQTHQEMQGHLNCAQNNIMWNKTNDGNEMTKQYLADFWQSDLKGQSKMWVLPITEQQAPRKKSAKQNKGRSHLDHLSLSLYIYRYIDYIHIYRALPLKGSLFWCILRNCVWDTLSNPLSAIRLFKIQVSIHRSCL